MYIRVWNGTPIDALRRLRARYNLQIGVGQLIPEYLLSVSIQ